MNASSQASDKILLLQGKLVASGNLQRADYNVFRDACRILCEGSNSSVYFDLKKCQYISSLFIGILVDTVTQLKAAGRTVKVEVSAEVGRLLHMAHLYYLFEYQVVEPQAERPA